MRGICNEEVILGNPAESPVVTSVLEGKGQAEEGGGGKCESIRSDRSTLYCLDQPRIQGDSEG